MNRDPLSHEGAPAAPAVTAHAGSVTADRPADRSILSLLRRVDELQSERDFLLAHVENLEGASRDLAATATSQAASLEEVRRLAHVVESLRKSAFGRLLLRLALLLGRLF